MRIAILSILTSVVLLATCQPKKEKKSLNNLATDYVRLGLEIGAYDPVFVDAYYGPDSLKFTGLVADSFPAAIFRERVAALKTDLEELAISSEATEEQIMRATWISSQLTAFDRRIRIVAEDYGTFDEEAEDLFGVEIPSYDSTHFIALIAELNAALPGEGTLQERKNALADKFAIPQDKMDTIFQVAIETARKITQEKFDLPIEETFTLEYVQDKTWSGYNWYQGGYKSLIQINTDHAILVDRVIDLACHEGYPGHHVYNMMLEKNLFVDKGWVEISLYPLFSPQSLIAEGSANFGIDMAFPGKKYDEFATEVLMPLAGLDTTGAAAYFKYIRIKQKLNYARNEAARGIINGTMTEEQVDRWLGEYALITTSVPFIKRYRSYVVNYNYGKDLVKNYIESQSETLDDRWVPLGQLLSNPVLPKEMLPEME
ncbi:hypothetical protein N7E81_10510 [Reichenbachiella carrageenanivorans]|uniref:DUF885 domain-containing protein n=1 Tax=Reichenbachiella carrageenanivorans TaxID=2979869 RepID=A0ABY6CV45_9BACT|nr:hypothetical protein [Reichenbachiella carrageenanivorans]UXX77802.1 hypothetical protein N7E81_10510 [Reichenbachiella carrageenanivorans]